MPAPLLQNKTRLNHDKDIISQSSSIIIINQTSKGSLDISLRVGKLIQDFLQNFLSLYILAAKRQYLIEPAAIS